MLVWEDLLVALDKSLPSVDTHEKANASNPIIKSERLDSAGMNFTQAQNDKFSGKCHYCHWTGHKIAECRRKLQDENSQQRQGYGSYGNGAGGQGAYGNQYNNNRSFSSAGGQRPGGFSSPGAYQQQRPNLGMSNYGVARGGVRGSVGPRQQVSSHSTMVDNSSYGNAGYNSGYMENAQFNFLEQQRTFLQQTEQLNWQLQQQQQQQQQMQQQQMQQQQGQQFQYQQHFNKPESAVDSGSNFVQSSVNTSEQEGVCASFPFFNSECNASEAFPATLNEPECSTGLLRVTVPFVLEDACAVVVALVDGGSTHSFLSPKSLIKEQRYQFNAHKHSYGRRLFNITSATGMV